MANIMSTGLGLLGGIAGNAAASKDRGHAQDLLDQAIAAYKDVHVPTNLADLINYQQYQDQGQLTPEQEQAILSGPSQQGAVKADPKMLSAQMQALDALKGLSQTGMSSVDKARLNQIQQQMATQAEGQKQQVMQNYQQRGLGGGGNELLAQLQAGQNASNQANQQGLQAAAQAQQAAQQALAQYGQQAGQLENQQFGQQSQSAQANDLNTRFNVQAQQAQQSRNVAAKNASQRYNLQNKQNIANANTNLGNTALNNQRAGEQQMFADQMQRAQGLAGANFTGSNAYNNLGNAKAQQWVNAGNSLGSMGDMQSAMGGGGGGGGGDGGGGPMAMAGGAGDDPFSMATAAATAAHGGTIGYDIPHMMAGGYASSGNMNAPYGQYADGGQVPYGGGNSGGGHMGHPQMQAYNPLLGPAAMAHGGSIPQYAIGGSIGGMFGGGSRSAISPTTANHIGGLMGNTGSQKAPLQNTPQPVNNATGAVGQATGQGTNVAGAAAGMFGTPQPANQVSKGPNLGTIAGMFGSNQQSQPAKQNPINQVGNMFGNSQPSSPNQVSTNMGMAPTPKAAPQTQQINHPQNFQTGNMFSGRHNYHRSFAEGGEVPQYAEGGLLDPSLTDGPRPELQEQSSGGGGGMSSMMSMLPMLAMLAAHGGPVPGHAPVKDDSYSNDKVHVLLSPGEVVIPRSISMHANAPEMAKLFMENEMRKQGRK